MKLPGSTIAELKKLLVNRSISSAELTMSYLQKINDANDSINAYITVTDEYAKKEAEKADTYLNNKKDLPLLGIPVAIKDNFCTAGMPTTAGSKLLADYIPPYSATVWNKLKEAGAILVGKTNLDAWAHGSSTENSDYGATKNPWDTTKLPGGSSGGSCAAVAADTTVFALGTETAGSIRQPASWCGVVGLKPTYGRTSRYGIIAMASSLDTPGPITKTVTDAAMVLQVIASNDPYNATTSKREVPDYTKILGKGIRDLKIGFAQDYFDGIDRNVASIVKAALKKLEELGAKIVEIQLLDPEYSVDVYTIVQRAEVSSNLGRYDGIRYGYGRHQFGQEAKRRIMLGTYSLSAGHYGEVFVKAEKVRTLIIKDFERAFKDVDVIACPTAPTVALPIGSSIDQAMFGEMADRLVEPSSIAGLPGISVPCGFSDNLPVGIQFIGPQFREDLILQVAYAYEQATEWHKRKPNLNYE